MGLPEQMARWGVLKRQIDTLEVEIKQQVLLLQKSQEFNGIIARFDSGRGRYDYERIVGELGVSEDTIAKFTTVVSSIDWGTICKALNPTEDFMGKFYTPGKPSVSLKFDSKKGGE